MTEFELKLEMPAGRLEAALAAMKREGAKRERLRAVYFDTQDGALVAHGIVVRMRKEGRKWVQTAKAPGSGALARLEHNAPGRHGGTAARPAPRAKAPDDGRHAGGHALVVAVVCACLDQVLAFASEVGAGSTDAEHIHKLRVGIRRLRTALRELASLSDGVDPAWEEPLVELFRSLGRHRDQHHLASSIEPRIEAAGGPVLDLASLDADVPDPGEAVREPAFQDTLLGLLAFVHRDSGAAGPDQGAANKHVRKALAKLHAQVLRDGRRFAALDEVRQHRVRKRLKRLRYLAEFARPLFGSRKSKDFLQALKPVQDALGVYNDEIMAARAYRALASRDANAWFAAGWLGARREPNAAACQEAIKKLSRARPFWD